MIVLGIDPACGHTGYAIIKFNEIKNNLTCIDYGVICPPRKLLYPHNFVYIFNTIKSIINTHSPNFISIEDIFFAKSAKSALRLGEIRGILLLAGVLSGTPVYLYPPLKIRKTVVGKGSAKKSQVKKIVNLILNLEEEISSTDASDAMATAICHIYHYQRSQKT